MPLIFYTPPTSSVGMSKEKIKEEANKAKDTMGQAAGKTEEEMGKLKKKIFK
jgi:hypothetical protein